jgi:hypothetical protein
MLARPPRLSLCLAALLAALATTSYAAGSAPPGVTSCSAAGCVTPYWGPGQIAAGFGVDNFRPGQTFAPKFSGVLSAVRLGLQTSGTVPAVVEIRTVINRLPTATILASTVAWGAPYTGGVFYSADFSAQPLVLRAGTPYAITLRANAFQTISILAAFPPCDSASTGTLDYVHSYDGGQTWAALETRDRSIIYEVCMDSNTQARAGTWGMLKSLYR